MSRGMSAVRPWPCISTAITFRVLESSPIHPVQLLVMVMNAPWSSTTGSPLPWTS